MKKLHSILALLLITICSMNFTACSSDDDEGSNSGVNKCYVEVDGKHIDFKYAYYFEDGEDCEIIFSTIDILYYRNNPNKIKEGILFSDAYIELDEGLTSGTTTDYDFEVDHNLDLYQLFVDEDGELHGENYSWYTGDWTKDMTPLTITKTGSNYNISASSIPMLASDGDDGIDNDSRKTTANIYFDGSLLDVTNYYIDDLSSRSVKITKVDKDFINWMKRLRNNK